MPHAMLRSLTVNALEGTPEVVARLLRGASPAAFDHTPDPNRFTLRAILPHLADFDPIFRGRIGQCRDEDQPRLVPRDEGQMALDNDYAHADPLQSLARFAAERALLVATLRDLTDDQWDRKGIHAIAGPVSIAELAGMVLSHDGYHTRQIAEWLADPLSGAGRRRRATRA